MRFFTFSLSVLLFFFSREITQTDAVICAPGDTYLANPDDCGSFYQCSNGNPVFIRCPVPLVFSPVLNVCVWSYQNECSVSETTTTQPTTTTTTTQAPVTTTESAGGPRCKPGDTYLPNPDDCTSFYQCAQGRPILVQCPHPLIFNPLLNVCDWAANYDCQVTTTTTSTTTTERTTTKPEPTTTTEPVSTERFIPCTENETPQSCHNSPNDCSFCFDPCFNHDNDQPRCDSYENLVDAGCKNFKFSMDEYDVPVDTSKNCTWLPVVPGEKRNITVTFKLQKHPLDLYYLMDFSGSMYDDKENLVRLSSRLVETVSELTTDFQIGFGTFVDKPLIPLGYYSDYSFLNNLPLTSSTDEFVRKIEEAPILDGYDTPEGHADGLSQVAACADEIGWRDEARKIILLATDADFHVAGDGALFGLSAPYVPGCYLNRSGYYSEELNMDYPSIDQLAAALASKDITTIFATSSYTKSFYDNVALTIKPSVVGILRTDSSNIITLLVDEFRRIESRMEIEKSETTDSVQFRYFSSCASAEGNEEETTICENLPADGEITFTIEIDLAECPTDKEETGMVVEFHPLGVPIIIELALSYMCDIDW